MAKTTKFEEQRAKLITLAENCEADCSYTGGHDRLGFTYRADDLAVVWTGDTTFVVVPQKGPIATKELFDDRSRLPKLIEDMCTDGDGILDMIAGFYRDEIGTRAV